MQFSINGVNSNSATQYTSTIQDRHLQVMFNEQSAEALTPASRAVLTTFSVSQLDSMSWSRESICGAMNELEGSKRKKKKF